MTEATLAEILAAEVTEAEALRNLAACVMGYTELKRRHNGRGRHATYAAEPEAIAGAARQLAERVLALLDR